MNQGFQPFLKQWFKTSPGQVMLKQEKQLIGKAIENLFGYFLVQLGCVSEENLTESSRITSKVLVNKTIDFELAKNTEIQWIQAELDFLPIGHDKADLVLLPHTLEAVDDPYYLLRQVDKMLMPEGHIVLTGFNGMACTPLRLKYFSNSEGFKVAKFRRANKLKEWLEVLGYDVSLIEYSSVMCFSTNEKYTFWVKFIEKIERALKWVGLDFGNVYCLVAKKRVDSPTLVGLKWHLPKWQGIKNGATASSVKSLKNHNKQHDSSTK